MGLAGQTADNALVVDNFVFAIYFRCSIEVHSTFIQCIASSPGSIVLHKKKTGWSQGTRLHVMQYKVIIIHTCFRKLCQWCLLIVVVICILS